VLKQIKHRRRPIVSDQTWAGVSRHCRRRQSRRQRRRVGRELGNGSFSSRLWGLGVSYSPEGSGVELGRHRTAVKFLVGEILNIWR